jgi:predicted nicotinamide N-methyase
MLPPTSYLPPIKDIQIYPIKNLNDALHYLRRIYNPEVRGSRRRQPLKNTPPPLVFTELDTLRTDLFERTYAIKWLTAFISQLGTENLDSLVDPPSIVVPSTEDLLQDAASLLAICAGTASAGVIVRQFVFENRHREEEDEESINLINVELVDVPLDNHDYRSVGAQTWGGACILAEMIVDHPGQFGIHYRHHAESSTFRCLELGAGTGLVSITVTKMMMMMMQNSTKRNTTKLEVEVVATDYYPSVLTNLERNIHSNFPESPSSASVRILTRALDWSTFSSQTNHNDPVFEPPFDLILGADIIYESQHALWIKSCLTKLLRKPSSTTPSDISPTFHLVIPLRATHIVESNTIEQVFSLNNHNRNGNTELVINHKEIIICDAESGREGEDVEYAYYKIGWGSVP